MTMVKNKLINVCKKQYVYEIASISLDS